ELGCEISASATWLRACPPTIFHSATEISRPSSSRCCVCGWPRRPAVNATQWERDEEARRQLRKGSQEGDVGRADAGLPFRQSLGSADRESPGEGVMKGTEGIGHAIRIGGLLVALAFTQIGQ